jgi:hypothetical protein
MESLLPLLVMAIAGIGLAHIYMKCRNLSQRAKRITRYVCSLSLAVACIGIYTAIKYPGPASRYQYNEATKLARDIIGMSSALPTLLIPVWLTLALATFKFPLLDRVRWPTLYVSIVGAVLSPIGLFTVIFCGCTQAGACF